MGYSMFAPTGVTHWDKDRAFSGFVLFATLSGDLVRLIDLAGETVKTWSLPDGIKPFYPQFLDNGNLLVQGVTGKETWSFGGAAGALLELDWDGNLVWRYEHPTLHHDTCRLRNGNTMVINWEVLDPGVTGRVQGGRAGSEMAPGIIDADFCWVPDLVGRQGGQQRAAGTIISDALSEIAPDGSTVWEWHGGNHLDPSLEVICPLEGRQEWTHCNGVEELPDGNLLLSFRQTSTILIVERPSGEVVWRWGPGQLSHQHDPSRLENGNYLIFDNGEHRFNGCYSRVVEMNPTSGEIVWEYSGEPKLAFFSTGISGAQRLSNGNTAICEGRTGRLFEVTHDGAIVWEYVNPHEFPHRGDRRNRAIFRAHRYTADSAALRGRV
ncbi:MAG: aryl sulfotransferase [Dehalococcoidia bacterium]|nr:aryl sulfotransferase [Dehalococcoidia bacterium]